MKEKVSVVAFIGAGLLVGAVGLAFALPWLIGRKWSTSRPSMWERRGGS